MAAAEIISTEPATGALVWRGWPGDVDVEVAAAHAAWPDWASRPLAVRIETMRRFVNVVRSKAEALADVISRETGKPLWDARSEVEGVLAGAESAISAYHERTAQRRLEGAHGDPFIAPAQALWRARRHHPVQLSCPTPRQPMSSRR